MPVRFKTVYQFENVGIKVIKGKFRVNDDVLPFLRFLKFNCLRRRFQAFRKRLPVFFIQAETAGKGMAA